MLEDEVRAGAVEHRIESSQDHWMAQPPQHLVLGIETSESALILDEVGANHLHHDDGIQSLVPCEVGLVAESAAQLRKREPTWCDLIALFESPPVLIAHRGLISDADRRSVTLGLPPAPVPGPVSGVVRGVIVVIIIILGD